MQDRSPLDWLDWCLPAGSLFGVRIGVHWIFPFVLVAWAVATGEEHGARWGWIVATAVLLLFLAVLIHELGHVAIARREGAECDRILLWPLGGLTTVGEELDGLSETRVAAAGPAMNAALLFLLIPVLLLATVRLSPEVLNPFAAWYPVPTTNGPASFAGEALWVFFRMNVVLLLFNLIPAFPLDGGRILRGLLAGRQGPVRSLLATTTVSLVVATALLVLAIVFGNLLLGLVALYVGARAWVTRRRVMARLAEGIEEPDGFLGYDFSMGRTSLTESAGRLLGEEERRAERERRAREEAEEEDRRIDEELDRLLVKIHESGMESLSRRERAFLEKASRRKR